MTEWNSWRRGIRPVDITWMPEEVELAPDWVREEILGGPEELQGWLSDHKPAAGGGQPAKPKSRRGRRPKAR